MRGPTIITTIIITAVSPRGARNSKSSNDDSLGRAVKETHNFNVVGNKLPIVFNAIFILYSSQFVSFIVVAIFQIF